MINRSANNAINKMINNVFICIFFDSFGQNGVFFSLFSPFYFTMVSLWLFF